MHRIINYTILHILNNCNSRLQNKYYNVRYKMYIISIT